jgi:CubicO group peptidase (beta-lactamase class C family)
MDRRLSGDRIPLARPIAVDGQALWRRESRAADSAMPPHPSRAREYLMKVAFLVPTIVLAACSRAPVVSTGGSAAAPVADGQRLASVEQRVDSIVRAKMLERHVVGASIAVVERGRVLKSTPYGVANLSTNEAVTRRTSFFVASITKVVSAAAAMMLVDDGRVALDDSLGVLLGGIPASWQQVTLRQLLGHTSGLPDVTSGPGRYIPTWEAALRELGDSALRAVPGREYQYTGTNWALVARIVEARGGQPFEEFATRRVLGRQDVRSAFFGGHERVGEGRAEWYTTMRNATPSPQVGDSVRLLRTDYPSYLHASNGLWISSEDLARWVDALARGLILKKESLGLTWAKVPLAAAATSREGLGGWGIHEVDGHTWILSEGGARAAVAHVRERGLTIAILTNTQGAGELAWLAEIANLYLARP